ncbi:bacillithiol biosynthesis deacetylase BshB1 [Marinilongibacter aquaticus]|uniref:bacillithiol biosynthesis deacetylase BshB1 n=1 Tax=Marinilongibacter aquaticus TaxID=2975157 RepID=UPI0021BD40D3|nr:bacillithiol biosynthesis deacetylase BshB1 [Marinilongibacter aquaticus]UBM58902.1 bacillithiol biosynthesis deacetylase BshB1 [Marinilongibacter aquaticus]
MKLDILVMAVHPDDAELGCAGTILKHVAQGLKVGLVDFTSGELGTRGSGELRLKEAAESAKVLGLAARENLGFRDGFFKNDEAHQLKLIEVIRRYQPEILIGNAYEDRHPDHGRASALTTEACFYSGLRRIETVSIHGEKQEAWRPKQVLHYIQDRYLEPDFVVDISEFWEKKVESIRAFKSQFFDPNSTEPESYIANPQFLDFIEGRARDMGHKIGATFGEGFLSEKKMQVKDLRNLL